MKSVEARLKKLAAAVYPTEAQLQRAKNSNSDLRRLLETGNLAGRIQESFLSGSYARHTALRPLNDVDGTRFIKPCVATRLDVIGSPVGCG